MKIVRFYTPKGTFGRLYDGHNKFLCYTLERNWDNNKPFTSCVPVGEYNLSPYTSSKYGDTVALVQPSLNVKAYKDDNDNSRYAILIHSANYMEQLQGCIALGMDLGVVDGHWAITSSRTALKKFLPLIKNSGRIVITD